MKTMIIRYALGRTIKDNCQLDRVIANWGPIEELLEDVDLSAC